MILKQGHNYEPMPHDGKVIRRIYRGGRCYYIASPYSPEATQALKAAFPQYFAAICDYGVAHPQLVPFVNEDPMLIVSLVEVGKTRWLVISRGAYIRSGVNMKWGIGIESILEIDDEVGEIWGTGNRDQNLTAWTKGGSNWRYMKSPISVPKWCPTIKPTLVRQDKTGVYIDGIKKGSYSGSGETINEIWLGGHDSFMKGRTEYWKIDDDGVLLRHFIPMQRTDGTCGMLDILSGTFYPNANTQGAFTIQVTDKA